MRQLIVFFIFCSSINQWYAQCVVQALDFYTNDFNTAVGSEWTVSNGSSPLWNGTSLGPFGPETLTYTDNNLPCHDSLVFNCTLYLESSWDGNGNYCCGPDIFYVIADGVTIFATTFSNTQWAGNMQSYPSQYDPLNLVNNPQGTGSVGTNLYNLSFAFPHTASSISIEIAQPASQGASDEGWYFDYFSLQLYTCGATTSDVSQSICDGSIYDFNGDLLTQAGTYQSVFVSQNGCDSTVNLTLSTLPTFQQSLSPEICAGDTYTFNSQNFSETGNYTVVLPTINGCDSTFTIALTVHPNYTTNLTDSICEGETYDFLGSQLQSAGSYPFNLQSVNGCDSTVIMNLIVNVIPDEPLLSVNIADCPGDIWEFKATQFQNAQISWTGPNNFTSNQYNVEVASSIENIGVYAATQTLEGCTSEMAEVAAAITNIQNIDDREFPNVITANNDNINDALDLKAYYNTCEDYEMLVLNRWGHTVYKQTPSSPAFNGLDSSGNALSPGIYFYRIQFANGEKTGFFHLIK